MTNLSDFDVVRSVLKGNRDDYAVLVRANQDKIKRYCLTLLYNPDEAEDAAQDVFVKAYQSLRHFRGNSSFSTWVYRIAHNQCMDLLRKKARQKTDSLEVLLEKSDSPAEPSLASYDTDSLTRENTEFVHKVLGTLRPDYREILMLREVGELSYVEMTKVLHCSLDAVKARLKRARNDLQENARHFMGSQTV